MLLGANRLVQFGSSGYPGITVQAVLLKPGQRFKSQVCETQFVVIKAPAGEVDLRCGGAEAIGVTDSPTGVDIDSAFSGGTLLGKRYGDAEIGIELLCSKGGAGSLSIGETILDVLGAKALPSSD